jgi:gliding motility-associated-like protein
VFVPTAFSPNDDGSNDEFYVQTECELTLFSMSVYNRWGDLIFKTHDPQDHWTGHYKGSIVQEGLYLYLLEYRKEVMCVSNWEIKNGSVLLTW